MSTNSVHKYPIARLTMWVRPFHDLTLSTEIMTQLQIFCHNTAPSPSQLNFLASLSDRPTPLLDLNCAGYVKIAIVRPICVLIDVMRRRHILKIRKQNNLPSPQKV